MNARTARFAALALLLVVATAGPATAAPPSTLSYRGRLATSGGQAISGIVSITFRLYDVASGGSALWTETRNNVVVDGGNLATELGTVTPLPRSLFGRQLYVGVQLAGDTEMLPRPPLTAAPFALRAGSTFKNTIFVPAEGTPLENGTALLAAVASAASATAQNPIAIELDAGTYDLGNQLAVVPAYVTLGGRSQEATTITSANPDSPLFLGSNTSAHDFTSRSTGTPATNYAAAALTIHGATLATPVDNVRVERVTGVSSGPPSAGGPVRRGIFACTTNSYISDVTAIGQGGGTSEGFVADCADASNNLYERVVAYASGTPTEVTGVRLSGGGAWRDFKVFVGSSAAYRTYGVRVFGGSNTATAQLSDFAITIHCDGVPSGTSTELEGALVYRANVDLDRVRMNIENAGAALATGLLITGGVGDHVVRATNSDVAMSRASITAGFGLFRGIGVQGASQISQTKVVLGCGPVAYDQCSGVSVAVSQVGAVIELDHVDVTVDNEGGATSSVWGYYGSGGNVRIAASVLHVLPGSATTAIGAEAVGTGASLKLSRSTLVVENAVAPTPACVLYQGGAAIELFGSNVQGQTCGPYTPAAICAGNTKRGTGFLASTCP